MARYMSIGRTQSDRVLTAARLAAEDNRVRAAYARRRQTIPPERYARTNPFTLCAAHEREEEMAAMFRAEGLTTLAGLRILDEARGIAQTVGIASLLSEIQTLTTQAEGKDRSPPPSRLADN